MQYWLPRLETPPRFPTVEGLAKEFGVSRPTMTKALRRARKRAEQRFERAQAMLPIPPVDLLMRDQMQHIEVRLGHLRRESRRIHDEITGIQIQLQTLLEQNQLIQKRSESP